MIPLITWPIQNGDLYRDTERISITTTSKHIRACVLKASLREAMSGLVAGNLTPWGILVPISTPAAHPGGDSYQDTHCTVYTWMAVTESISRYVQDDEQIIKLPCYCSGSLEPESSCHDRDWIMVLPMEADILTFTGILTPEDASVASCWPALRAGLLCCNFFGQPGSVSKFPPFVWIKLWVGWVGRGYTEISRYFPASWINWVTLVTKIKLMYSLRF